MTVADWLPGGTTVDGLSVDGLSKAGRILFGVGITLFGLLYLFHAGAGGPAPGPPWTAETGTLAWLIGAGFVVAGVCIVSRRWAGLASALLGAALVLWVLFAYLPGVFEHPRNPGPWTSGAEVLALGAAALVLAGGLDALPAMRWEGLVVAGRLLFAAALVVFGVQHFLYAKFVATLVPAWIRGHLFCAYFAGVSFLAAGLSIALKIQAHLAAALLGLMFLLWVVMLHAPRVVGAVHNGNEWTSAFVALSMCGGSFVLAGALRQGNH
ncbi:MAG: hypothetical protein ABI158_12140 [Edaphobacter sp.]